MFSPLMYALGLRSSFWDRQACEFFGRMGKTMVGERKRNPTVSLILFRFRPFFLSPLRAEGYRFVHVHPSVRPSGRPEPLLCNH